MGVCGAKSVWVSPRRLEISGNESARYTIPHRYGGTGMSFADVKYRGEISPLEVRINDGNICVYV